MKFASGAILVICLLLRDKIRIRLRLAVVIRIVCSSSEKEDAYLLRLLSSLSAVYKLVSGTEIVTYSTANVGRMFVVEIRSNKNILATTENSRFLRCIIFDL